MKVECEDGVIEDDFIFGAVSNSLSIGGFKGLPAEEIFLDDGELEVLLVRMPKKRGGVKRTGHGAAGPAVRPARGLFLQGARGQVHLRSAGLLDAGRRGRRQPGNGQHRLYPRGGHLRRRQAPGTEGRNGGDARKPAGGNRRFSRLKGKHHAWFGTGHGVYFGV